LNIGLAVALLGMTSLAVAILLVPLLLRSRAAASREAYNLAVYRDQLAELDRDIGRGVLTPDQAEAARAEIGRRILALAPSATATGPASAVPFAVAVVSVLVLPFAAWSLYAALGSPSLPDQPFAARTQAATAQIAEAAPPHDMTEAMAKLSEHLKQQPDDLGGWVLLARSQMSVGQFKEASDAYSHAAQLAKDNMDVIGDWGEAQVLAAGGTVTPAARDAFEKTLKDPENAPRSRYYLALAAGQDGDRKGALQQWVDLEGDSPADADWLPMLRQRITETAGQLGRDPATLKTSAGAARPNPATRPPQVAAAPQVAAPAAALAAPQSSAPDPARVREAQQALANAPAEDRQAMINSMVERLAARLEQQPNDIDGWTRLGRSYMVLNEPAKARDAYAHAIKLRPDDPQLKAAYAEAVAAAK
jgi:cytochrome c-type biogenesis protein CcmH